jgi:hypothetical protein
MSNITMDTHFNGCWAIVDGKFHETFFTPYIQIRYLKYFGSFLDSKFVETLAMICLRTVVKNAVYPSPGLSECRIHLLCYYGIYLCVHMNCHGIVQWFHMSTGHLIGADFLIKYFLKFL